jgi:hypothetical protein
MSSKYVRHQPAIQTHSTQSDDEDTWLNRFQKNLSKDAVQPRQQNSLFDQINSIMNGKSKFPTVDAAVQDMKERSGLTAYLQKIKQSSDEEVPSASKKVASDNQQAIDKKVEMIPIVMKKNPQIQKTVENYIRDTRGNLSVPAIISKVQSIHQNDVSDAKDWDDDKLVILVSKLNLAAKKDNPGGYQDYSNLGTRDSGSDSEIDPSNTDAFFALTPVTQ